MNTMDEDHESWNLELAKAIKTASFLVREEAVALGNGNIIYKKDDVIVEENVITGKITIIE